MGNRRLFAGGTAAEAAILSEGGDLSTLTGYGGPEVVESEADRGWGTSLGRLVNAARPALTGSGIPYPGLPTTGQLEQPIPYPGLQNAGDVQ